MKKFNRLVVALSAGLLICGAKASEPQHTRVEYAENKGWKLIWNDEFDGKDILILLFVSNAFCFVESLLNPPNADEDEILKPEELDSSVLYFLVLQMKLSFCLSTTSIFVLSVVP